MLFALRYILNASQNNHSKSIQADKLQCAIENGKRLTIHKNSKRGRETDRDRDRDIKNILPAVSKNSIVFGSVCLQMQIMNVHAKRACPFQMHTHTHIRWTICWTQQKNIQNRCYFVTRHWHRYQHQNMDFVVATTMVLMFSCWFNFFFRLFRFYYHLRAGISMLIFSHFMRITLEFCIWTESSLLLNDSKFRDSKQNNSYFLCWTNAVSSNKQIFDEPIDARRQVKSNRINDFICND